MFVGGRFEINPGGGRLKSACDPPAIIGGGIIRLVGGIIEGLFIILVGYKFGGGSDISGT